MFDASDVPLLILGLFAVVYFLVIINRSLIVINPGQEGLVYYQGRYKRTLSVGVSWINPMARVVKVASGVADKIQIGAVAVVDVPTDSTSFSGRIRVGNIVIAARSTKPIPAGTRVRVVTPPRSIDFVDVTSDESGAPSAGRPIR